MARESPADCQAALLVLPLTVTNPTMKTIAALTPAKVKAVFENCGVACEDAAILQEVRLVMASVLRSPSIPDLDSEHARAACRALGGEIIAYDDPPKIIPGRIY